MSIDRADIEKLGELARISVNEETIDATTRSINEVLALVDQLQSANTIGVQPLANPLDAKQRLRRDVVCETNRREDFQPLAPATENGLYLVPKVIT